MEGNCKPFMLVEEEGFCIAQCENCKKIGLFFNNILAGFMPSDFKLFSRKILKLDFIKNSIVFPDGLRYILINTCHADIQFCFTHEEFIKLKQGLAEAMLLIEAQDILSGTKR